MEHIKLLLENKDSELFEAIRSLDEAYFKDYSNENIEYLLENIEDVSLRQKVKILALIKESADIESILPLCLDSIQELKDKCDSEGIK